MTERKKVAVVGGGLAGLAAAAVLCERGFAVELFEAGKRLGGRAGSFRDAVSGRLVDACQHVAMGCCTNLADFLRRTGTDDCFVRRRRLHFVAPDGKRHELTASAWLPAPLHLAPGLMRLVYLPLRDRLRIVRTLGRLAKLPAGGPNEPATIGSWLALQGESDRTVDRFWSVVLTSALSETLDCVSLAAARKVVVEGFLASRHAYELEVPRVPLAEIFDRRVADWLSARGATVHRRLRVQSIDGDARHARAVVLADGSRRPFDYIVVAVPWRAIRSLIAPAMLAALPALDGADRIEAAPITAVHLWLDRPIPGPSPAVLVGRMSQWLFRRDRVFREVAKPVTERTGEAAGPGCYCQVVISASHALVDRPHRELVDRVKGELGAIWPTVRRARLLRRRVIAHREAVFSCRPGLEPLRPEQPTPIPNLMLAGDWTSTGWPATMEGAVRSGYLAAEAVSDREAPHDHPRLPVPDLPRARLVRWLLRTDEES